LGAILGSLFGSILAPKINGKMHRNLMHFLMRFGCHLASILGSVFAAKINEKIDQNLTQFSATSGPQFWYQKGPRKQAAGPSENHCFPSVSQRFEDAGGPWTASEKASDFPSIFEGFSAPFSLPSGARFPTHSCTEKVNDFRMPFHRHLGANLGPNSALENGPENTRKVDRKNAAKSDPFCGSFWLRKTGKKSIQILTEKLMDFRRGLPERTADSLIQT